MQAALFKTMAAGVAAECERLTAEARQEAERIVSEARQAAAQRGEAERARVQAELADLEKRAAATAKADGERDDLSMQHAVCDDVLDQVRDEARKIAESPDFPRVLNALMGEVLRESPPDVMLQVPEAHLEHCREWLHLYSFDDVELEPSAELKDGVAVQDKARTFRIANTLTGRLTRLEGQARRDILSRLFGDTASP